jgi:hypothetical protein
MYLRERRRQTGVTEESGQAPCPAAGLQAQLAGRSGTGPKTGKPGGDRKNCRTQPSCCRGLQRSKRAFLPFQVDLLHTESEIGRFQAQKAGAISSSCGRSAAPSRLVRISDMACSCLQRLGHQFAVGAEGHGKDRARPGHGTHQLAQAHPGAGTEPGEIDRRDCQAVRRHAGGTRPASIKIRKSLLAVLPRWLSRPSR